ncbi:MAG: hypothetical protein GY832_29555 [Chloroflexi bacterium]|nr:hypothetical protein [Chloroflexota bacterium]
MGGLTKTYRRSCNIKNILTNHCTGFTPLRSVKTSEFKRSAAALSHKERGRLPAERPGAIRRFVVNAFDIEQILLGTILHHTWLLSSTQTRAAAEVMGSEGGDSLTATPKPSNITAPLNTSNTSSEELLVSHPNASHRPTPRTHHGKPKHLTQARRIPPPLAQGDKAMHYLGRTGGDDEGAD